jgi:hypothetical protein
VALDDVIILCTAKAATSNIPTTTPTAGIYSTAFSPIGSSIYSNGTSDALLHVWAAKITSLPSAATNVLLTIAASGGTTVAQTSVAFILRGVDFANLIALTGGAQRVDATGTASAVPDPPAVTPSGTVPWLMAIGAGAHTSIHSAYTIPTGLNTSFNHWRTVLNNTPSQKSNIGAGFLENWNSGTHGASPNCPPFGGGVTGAAASWAASVIVIPALAAGATGQMKVWNGSAWVAKPVKVWNGSAWVVKPLKYWNGSAWVVTPY